MTDLSTAVWKEVEKYSVMHDGYPTIRVATLKNILRKSRRSNDQNALLWALYDDVLQQGGETLGGWSKDDLHEYVLGEYFGWDEHKAFGRTRLKPKKRSSRLSKMEFADLLEFIVRRMAEHGIVLELPGEIAA